MDPTAYTFQLGPCKDTSAQYAQVNNFLTNVWLPLSGGLSCTKLLKAETSGKSQMPCSPSLSNTNIQAALPTLLPKCLKSCSKQPSFPAWSSTVPYSQYIHFKSTHLIAPRLIPLTHLLCDLPSVYSQSLLDALKGQQSSHDVQGPHGSSP